VFTHFDIPDVSQHSYSLYVFGQVRTPLRLSLPNILRRPSSTLPVTLECAGNGRSTMKKRLDMTHIPWRYNALGTALWTGTPLKAVLEEAELLDGARCVVFTGLDKGVQKGEAQSYQFSLSVAEATRD